MLSQEYFRYLCLFILILECSTDTSVTYPGIGTFNRNDFYHPYYRPINHLPHSPEFINPTFYLYNNEMKSKSAILYYNETMDRYLNSGFNPNYKTKILIHGYGENIIISPVTIVYQKELLKQNVSVNIINIDWTKVAFIEFTQSMADIRVLGAMVGILIENLCNAFNITEDSFHILGHSVGAHVAAYAGKYLNGKLSRITGLDPAGLYFQGVPNPEKARLYHTDAQFVDVIHTDAVPPLPFFGFGTKETCGHVDIYPNGGKFQPGCFMERFTTIIDHGLKEAYKKFILCNHGRSVDYFTEALTYPESEAVAFACDDYESFLRGECKSCGEDGLNCVHLAMKKDQYQKLLNNPDFKPGMRYYMTTGSSSKYLRYQYLVQLNLSEANFTKSLFGSIKIKFIDQNDNENEVKFHQNIANFYPGKVYSTVVAIDIHPEHLHKIEVHWRHLLLNLIPTKIHIDSLTVVPLSEKGYNFTYIKKEGLSPGTHFTFIVNEKRSQLEAKSII